MWGGGGRWRCSPSPSDPGKLLIRRIGMEWHCGQITPIQQSLPGTTWRSSYPRGKKDHCLNIPDTTEDSTQLLSPWGFRSHCKNAVEAMGALPPPSLAPSFLSCLTEPFPRLRIIFSTLKSSYSEWLWPSKGPRFTTWVYPRLRTC